MKDRFLNKTTLLVFSLFCLFLSIYLSASHARRKIQIPPCFRIGGDLHHYYEPNCVEESVYGKIQYAINEDSLRERPRKEIKPGGVLLLGDSWVEGHNVAFKDTLGQQLEQLDSRRNFINAGVRTRGPIIQSIVMRPLLQTYKPKLIVWLLNETDPGDDKLAYALKTTVDNNGVPLTLSTEDFDSLSRLGSWRKRFGSVSGILDHWLYLAYDRKVLELQNRAAHEYRSCSGVERGVKIAKQHKVPILFVATTVQRDQLFDADYETLLACVKDYPFLDMREKIRALASENFLRDQIHLNPGGIHWLAKEMLGPIHKILR